LAPPGGPASTLVYDVAVDRLLDFAGTAGAPLTLFAIGADLARAASAARLRAARDAGHEIANHSLDHRYDLVRLSKDEIRAQIDQGSSTIERAAGERPSGFRAPGYTITDAVFDTLAELGVAYDSSVFPCPPYWAAKATAIGWIAARGRESRAILDTPAVLRAPTRPYRVGKPFWKRGRGMLELPVQVTRGLRLPFIGTYLTLGGPTGARWLTRMCIGEPFVNLELHGIDVLDVADGLDELRPHQPDVRVPSATKLAALHTTVETLRRAGYSFVTLREAAHEVERGMGKMSA
jgi:hypothetical protein